MLEHAESAPKTSTVGVVELIHFFANEARPEDVLEALVRWCTPTYANCSLYPVFQTVLIKGAQNNALTEVSGSLHRVILAHSRFEEAVEPLRTDDSEPESPSAPTESPSGKLWTQLSHGTLLLDK